MKRFRIKLGLLLGLLVASTAAAHTMAQVEETCPLDGTKFTANMDMSGTSFGRDLDLREVGAIASPWSVAVCPKDHFVLYKEQLSPDELTDLKVFVPSADYQKWVKDNPSYFLIGKILEHRKEPAGAVAFAYLKASWQVAGSQDAYARSAGEALKDFKIVLASSPSADDMQTAELVSGELERRTGDFTAAQARFRRLSTVSAFQSGTLKRIVDYQLQLIAAKDRDSHRIPDAPKQP
jgi:hypothetical protein